LKREARTAKIPVVMLTAKDEEADIVTGLEPGADDYIIKPFSPRSIVARLKAVLRRLRASPVGEEPVITYRDLSTDLGRHEVLPRDQHIPLTTTEFRILHLLARQPGWVFTRYQIVAEVQGEGAVVTERSVNVYMAATSQARHQWRGHRDDVWRGVSVQGWRSIVA
jgi:two-component system phosphate regulon response regulator PhoB